MMNIVVVGGGTAGWISAAYLSNKCGHNVTLVESDQIGIVGVGESTIPSIVNIFESCGVTESDLFEQCNAVRKYGIVHHNWTKHYPIWEHWFAFEGDQVNDSITAMNNYTAGPTGRYAYHLDARALPNMLKSKNPRINHVIDNVKEVIVDQHGVKSIVGDKNNYVGDVYIDCTGFKSIVRGQFPYKLKSHKNLINNYAVAGPSALVDSPKRRTHTFAMDHGWRWKIDLTHRSGNGYAFNKDLVSIDSAVNEFVRVSGVKENDVFEVPISNSFITDPYHKNVLSVGLSSGFLEPLEATGIYLIYSIVELFEQFRTRDRAHDLVNKMWTANYNGIASFLELFYTTSDLDHTEYWRSFEKVDRIRYKPNTLFKKYPSWTGLAENRRVILEE